VAPLSPGAGRMDIISRMKNKIRYRPEDWARRSGLGIKVNDERTPSEIDRSRILHSAAFRRLAAKTQIFGVGQDSFFRSRLTHSLEVAQIAKGIALRVGADVETCEAAALAHDIGHPPFGHRGEAVLARLMSDHGGFEANAQNFRILTRLEVKFRGEPGLDLTRTVLDGILKYRERWDGEKPKFYFVDDERVLEIVEWASEGFAARSLECQIMDWADDVAYSSHDFEDGLHAGMISTQLLWSFSEEIVADARKKLKACTEKDFQFVMNNVVQCEAAPPDEREATVKTLTSRIINTFLQVDRAPRASSKRSDPTRHRWDLTVPPALRRKCQMLKSAAFVLLVSDPRVASLEARADRVIASLFDLYRDPTSTTLYPEPFRSRFRTLRDNHSRARVACAFIAGMGDDYAERVYSRVFSGNRAALTDY